MLWTVCNVCFLEYYKQKILPAGYSTIVLTSGTDRHYDNNRNSSSEQSLLFDPSLKWKSLHFVDLYSASTILLPSLAKCLPDTEREAPKLARVTSAKLPLSKMQSPLSRNRCWMPIKFRGMNSMNHATTTSGDEPEEPESHLQEVVDEVDLDSVTEEDPLTLDPSTYLPPAFNNPSLFLPSADVS